MSFHTRVITRVKTKKVKKIKWRRPHRNKYQWVNELAISDQETLFQEMELFATETIAKTDNIEYLFTPPTESKWDNLIKNLEKFIDRTAEPLGHNYETPRLLSFPDNFNRDQLQDIIEWYENMLCTNTKPETSNPSDPPISNPSYVKALTKASKILKQNHFVFEGVNYFFKGGEGKRYVMGLFREKWHRKPIMVQRLHPKCHRQLIPPEMKEFHDENNQVHYQRTLEWGGKVICTKNGKIKHYLPCPVSPNTRPVSPKTQDKKKSKPFPTK